MICWRDYDYDEQKLAMIICDRYFVAASQIIPSYDLNIITKKNLGSVTSFLAATLIKDILIETAMRNTPAFLDPYSPLTGCTSALSLRHDSTFFDKHGQQK